MIENANFKMKNDKLYYKVGYIIPYATLCHPELVSVSQAFVDAETSSA